MLTSLQRLLGTTPNLFNGPISSSPPSSIFPRQSTHPVSTSNISNPSNKPISTNKWYSNLFLGNKTNGVWTLPYMLWVSRDAASFGLAISHTDEYQLALGPDPSRNPVQYYLSPLGIKSLQLGALELGAATDIVLDTPKTQSVSLNLLPNPGDYSRKITFPLAHGMGFVTGCYTKLTPALDSGVMFRQLIPLAAPRVGLQKWKVILEDGKAWVIYACPEAGTPLLQLSLINNRRLQGTNGLFSGFIQIAKIGAGDAGESVLDSTAGAFITDFTLSGAVFRKLGKYSFKFARFGQNNANALLMYALPHHVESFEPDTAARKANSFLRSTTKGMMTAVVSDDWKMTEQVPGGMGWVPGNPSTLSTATLSKIREAAVQDLGQDVDAQSNLDSMYFSGKALAKYAQVALVLALVVKDYTLAKQALQKLIGAISRFTQNNQKFKLVYEEQWKGIASEAAFKTGDPNVDFGNSYYNDHHFHYGYFIYAAACITCLDDLLNHSNAWLTSNRDWVNTLVRDTANPSDTLDPYFPQLRAFDFFHGHSWAKGLFDSADGKDQESSSEDSNFAYALYLWGKASGQGRIRDLGLLKLGIMRHSFNSYFLLSSTNHNHPRLFIDNKVTGILFENKVDHATYFGMNIEYIQGIHMIPTTPCSTWIRDRNFVSEEWEKYFSNGRVDTIQGGWRGILYANLSLLDPATAWKFFAGELPGGCKDEWLDGGMSRSWGMVMAAGLGGGA